MRAAIVHYWLLEQRGGEKVLDALCRLLPDADIFTLFCDPQSLSPEVRKHRVVTSFLNPLRRWYRSLLPLMPLALENLDLRGYDLVVSSESGPAKGVILPSTTRHICYCHTPMRYLWELYPEYRNKYVRSRFGRAAMAPFANYLRLWDFASAARVDRFIANSENVRQRIWKTYRRESEVIYPPVDVASFYSKPANDYFLIVAELVPYKRIDVAVRVFTRTGRHLIIAGSGPEYRKLKSMAGPTIEFAGRVPDPQLRELYASSRALVIPGEEDFGITAVEALASGKPVVAYGRGGVLESVPLQEPCGGVLYDLPDESRLEAALHELERLEPRIVAEDLQRYAERFSPERFSQRMAPALGVTDIPVPTVKSAVN
jgi:glycosyltransferase involved in cell wall biosynthesis